MAVLNPPGILPNVARAIYRYLLHADGQRENANRLESLVSPRSLFAGAEDEVETAKKVSDGRRRAYVPTLNSLIELGLLVKQDDFVALNPALPKEALRTGTGDSLFAATMRALTLQASANTGEWESQEGARDLTLGLAWFLMQRVVDPPGTWEDRGLTSGAQQAQARQLPQRVIRNDTRWGAFVRWSRFLGFTWQMSLDGTSVLVPDPTQAVESSLARVFKGKRNLTVGTFVQRLADELPVLDEGAYWKEVRNRLKAGQDEFPQDALSPALSHALLMLKEAGTLSLSDKADAQRLSLSSDPDTKLTVSHVGLIGQKKESA
jgi:hypothetical protein